MEMFGMGVLAGLGFWPMFALGVWLLLLLALVASEHTGFAFLSVVFAVLVAQFGFEYDIVGTIYNDPMWLVPWVVGYIALGIGYSVFRWWRYCAKWVEKYNSAAAHMKEYYWKYQPSPASSKSRLVGWMMFWPWSFFWYVFSDLIINIFEWIYKHFVTLYDRIAAHHISQVTPPK